MRLIRNYANSKRTLTILRADLRSLHGKVARLADDLKFQPEQINLADFPLDAEAIRQAVRDYQDTLEVKREMEETLRGVSLEEIITPDGKADEGSDPPEG